MNTERSYALVTGASGGLGAEIARQLANRGHDLVLTARSEEQLKRLASEIRKEQGVRVEVAAIDLALPGAAQELASRLDEQGIDPQILVNNAAFGLSGAFIEQNPSRIMQMIQLDISALTELTHIYGSRMADQRGGHIMLVASLASYMPSPLLAVYGAAKAYVLSLGEALHVELQQQNVAVTVLSPGLMDTGFNAASGFVPSPSARRSMLPVETVAKVGIDALFARRSSVVAGQMNRMMAALSRLASNHWMAKFVYKTS